MNTVLIGLVLLGTAFAFPLAASGLLAATGVDVRRLSYLMLPGWALLASSLAVFIGAAIEDETAGIVGSIGDVVIAAVLIVPRVWIASLGYPELPASMVATSGESAGRSRSVPLESTHAKGARGDVLSDQVQTPGNREHETPPAHDQHLADQQQTPAHDHAPSQGGPTAQETPRRHRCRCKTESASGGQSSWSEKGESGKWAWAFWFASWYRYNLSIDFDLIAVPCRASVVAVSSGSSIPWYASISILKWIGLWKGRELDWHTRHRAEASVDAQAKCSWWKGANFGDIPGCKCEVTGGKDSRKDDEWSAAAVAKPLPEGCGVEVTGAVAFKGEVIVKEVTVGVELGQKGVGKASAEAVIEFHEADRRGSSTREYRFACEEEE